MKKLISLMMALLMLALCLTACGGSDEVTDASKHDSRLTGYWLIEKRVIADEDETEADEQEEQEKEDDIAGNFGIEFYENGMIRIMERQAISAVNKYAYSDTENYPDYMIFDNNKIAYLDQNNNGEMMIEGIFEYSVKGDTLTLVGYSFGKEITTVYKRLDTPFYKYFPELPSEESDGNVVEDFFNGLLPDEN